MFCSYKSFAGIIIVFISLYTTESAIVLPSSFQRYQDVLPEDT